MDSQAEIRRLQGCVNDLLGILALPAIWSGRSSSEILGTLLDALSTVLRLDLAFARVGHPIDGSPIEVTRVGAARVPGANAGAIVHAIDAWLTSSPSGPGVITDPVSQAPIAVAQFQFGIQEGIGVLAG